MAQNLLANAVQYSHPGGRVTLGASCAAAGLELRVTDTGPGIPAGQVPHLFEPFYRGDAAHAADEEGHLGLGLFLVRTHLLALGGRCDVESELGRGSCFVVTVPDVRRGHDEPG